VTRTTPSNVADLTLRFGDRRLRGRVYWPPALGANAALTVLLAGTGTGDDTENADLLSRGLSSVGYVVLAVRGGSDRSYEMAALGWAAEHAPELGACSDRLVVGGHQGGGARAALLAIGARDEGWPPLRRQLLVHPTFTAACPVPSTISGVVPATVVASGEPHDDGSRFAAHLRRETIPVEELRYPRGALRGNEEAQARLFTDLGRAAR
jgi:alpha/beta hydrolase fold